MSESWTWTFEDGSGDPVTGPPTNTTSFPSQSDAENWLGEVWRDLSDAGVAAVNLHCDQSLVYGPMSLETPQ